ncbi:hypothetical protein [Blastococcus sp. Marseille-P5729]|uniref:hypothetical protein n=1 Tax=Blastococcus sp. Marseille-P5729 TaxID=2086582 RepID=UPI000D0E8EBA|nr:hypothetical protein [Blastococcus sp. Marseille-P5729]
MRWERLLADIEAAEAARDRADMLGEAAERARHETGQVTMAGRLRAAVGTVVTIEVDGPQRCAGTLSAVGSGWLVLESGPASWLIATAHVVQVADLPRPAAPGLNAAARRVYEGLGLRHALRGIAADRSAVQIGLGGNGVIAGTIDRVGADFVDLAVHPVGEPRRARDVQGARSVPITAIRYVRRSSAQ